MRQFCTCRHNVVLLSEIYRRASQPSYFTCNSTPRAHFACTGCITPLVSTHGKEVTFFLRECLHSRHANFSETRDHAASDEDKSRLARVCAIRNSDVQAWFSLIGDTKYRNGRGGGEGYDVWKYAGDHCSENWFVRLDTHERSEGMLRAMDDDHRMIRFFCRT